MNKRVQFLIVFFLIFETLFFTMALKVFKVERVFIYIVAFLSLASYIFFFYEISSYKRSVGPQHSFYWALGLMILHIVPKMVAVLFWIITSILVLLPSKFVQPESLAGRRKFLGTLGLGLAAIPFISIVYGLWKGKYNFKVLNRSISFSELPKGFDGFKILQISDLHSGSFDNAEEIAYAVDLINQQDFDVLLFTGDIVNTKAEEFLPWVEIFKKLKTPKYGKFSVLGNHDYGEYVSWPSEAAKNKNFEAIKELHKKIDFKLMCNENTLFEKGGEQIRLIGVENWGQGFKQAGDLQKASEGVDTNEFKILMSHDPSHWDLEVKNHPKNYQLTLSGHTHGLQFGIEIPGWFKWSPVQYRYKQWADLYTHDKKHIYVNRGFGFHAFPGRVGIWPEITVLELKTT